MRDEIDTAPVVLLGLDDAAEQLVALDENRIRLRGGPDSDESGDEERENVDDAEDTEPVDTFVSDADVVSDERWRELESLAYEEVLNFTNSDSIKVELSISEIGDVLILENILVPEAKRGKGVFRR